MRELTGKIMDQRQKDLLISEIANFLSRKKPVLFAYIYGSFLGEGLFRDVDVAACVDPGIVKTRDEMFAYGLSLAAEADLAISGVTIDLRLLNLAPIPFKFSVFTKGKLLFIRSDEARISFEARTRGLYFDFLPHLTLHHRHLLFGE
jgi:predicted nucleotidyltransferase